MKTKTCDTMQSINSALSALADFRIDDRESWLRVGMSVHAGTGGSEAGLNLWDSWSRQSEKYRPGECPRQWRSFEIREISLGTLIHMADTDCPDWRKRPNHAKQRPFPKNPKLPQSPPQIKPQKPLGKFNGFPAADEAIAVWEKQLGPISAKWEYLDAEWQTCGYVLRWNTPEGKTLRPVSRGFDGLWYLVAMPRPRPIYNLPYIRESGHDEPVIVCEGEKDCDVFDSCGLLVTTSSGGAQAATFTDWTPLAGRKVIICPDNDPTGKKYAEIVCGILQRLKPLASVRIFLKPQLRPKESVADWLVAQLASDKGVK